ncbi:MAG TPA: response regulator [Polyangia bacterium]|nr:response regulator [Polyangia bacterium]
MCPKESHKILVVDDDADIREVLTEVLIESGHDVKTASNGLEALGILRNGWLPCMVLLDLMMPVMDGYGFLAERKHDPALCSVPIMVITAGRQVDLDRLEGATLVGKPIRLPALMSLIEKTC